jgi:tripartite-type tricarboxylate transporter receptor subunit TctC
VFRLFASALTLCAHVCVLAFNAPAAAQQSAGDSAEFFRGKTISLVVGYSPGGGFDQAARILAKSFGRAIPGNPSLIVRNMPGAGSLVAANYVNNTAPRDGTVIAVLNDQMLIAPLLKTEGAMFDPRKIGWLGASGSRGTTVIFLRADSGVTTFEESQRKTALIAATGPDATSSYALLANELLGMKLQLVMGYRGGSSEMNLAIARGEVHGRVSWDWESLKHYQPDWLANKMVNVIVQLGMKPNPELPNVPIAINLAKSEEDRQIMEIVFGAGQFLRNYSVPAGVPEARLADLRAAFAKTMADPEFRRDTEATTPQGVDYSPPEKIDAFLDRVYSFPPRVIERAAKFVGQ